MVDKLNVLEDKQGQKIEILLHSGRNRILRRMFEKLGYEVKNLDRFAYGGITHKFLLRGKWRFLTEREVFGLKRYMN